MDKLDLIKKGIKVAATCTAKPNVSGVLKTICTDFIPDVIDFIAEKKVVNDMRREEMMNAGEEFDPFAQDEVQANPVEAEASNKM